MKNVRFTQVVEKCGQPEIYLLFTKPEDDADFQKALKASRIMTVHTGPGSKTDFGAVGYEGEAQAQLLIFPRSLKSFEGSHVVGIKYDLLHEEHKAPAKKRPASAARTEAPVAAAKAGKKSTKERRKEPTREKSKPASHIPERVDQGKVLKFPAHEKATGETEEDSEIKAKVRRAVKALADGRQVAAFNILKSILEN